jgi:hypothetical protein
MPPAPPRPDTATLSAPNPQLTSIRPCPPGIGRNGRLIGQPNRLTGYCLPKTDDDFDLSTPRVPTAGSENRSAPTEPADLSASRTG